MKKDPLDVLENGLRELQRQLEEPFELGQHAIADFQRAAELEKCPVCRATWETLSEISDRAVRAAELSDHIARHSALQELMTEVLVWGDNLLLWDFLSGIVGKIRQWPR